MLIRKELTAEQIKTVLREREFGPEVVRSTECVAVVLTQGWCPQWTFFNEGLAHLEATGEPAGRTIHVFSFVYDESEFFDEFLTFKENILGNSHIPYVRYYRNGTLVDESNYVAMSSFLERWKE